MQQSYFGGISRSKEDACRNCDFWEGGPGRSCLPMGELLGPVLAKGAHLDLVHCPEYRAPLGAKTGKRR